MTVNQKARQATFVTFGTAEFSQARARYIRSLARFGCDRVMALGPDAPCVVEARAENPDIFAHARGYGYWLWKPYIIEAAMDAAGPGEPVMYSDIALEMVGSPERLLALADELAEAGKGDVFVFRIGTGMPQRMFTKRDTFLALDADSPEFWDDEQVCGGFVLVRNTDRAREFIGRWRRAMQDPAVLLEAPSRRGLPELPEFRVHRHDQSILSILATRDRLPMLVDPSQWGRDRDGRARMPPGPERFVPVDYGQVFQLHRYRDAPIPRRIARRVRDFIVAATRK